jgi:hypothetical protein
MGIEGNVKAGVAVGVGLKGSAGASFGAEKIGFELELGASLGVGAEFKIDVSFSPKELLRDIGRLFSW